MVIYGNTISFGGGGGSNDTLPPLLDNFRANKGKHETVDFLSVPAGSTILLGKYKGKPIRWKVIDGFANKAGERGNNYLRIYDRNLISPRAYYEGYNYQESLPNDGSREDFTKTTLCKWLNSPDKKSPYYGNESGFLYEWTAEERNVLINWWRNTGWAINVGITVEVPEGAHIGFPHPTDPNNTFWRGLNFEKKAATTVVYTYETLSSGTLSPKAPEKEAEYLVSNPLSVEPEISIDSLTQFVFNGTDYVLESAMETQPIVISADKMEESRAKDLAGAVWVYGEHEPKNVNDGTKISLTRDEVITNQTTLPPIALSEISSSSAAAESIINIKESDGKLHPYIYLCKDYPTQNGALLLRKDCVETQAASKVLWSNSTLRTWCNDTFFNKMVVKDYVLDTTVMGESSSTSKDKVFLLSLTEMGFTEPSGGVALGKKIDYFSSDARRIAFYNGVGSDYWTRSTIGLQPYYITSVGRMATISTPQNVLKGLRPAFVLPLSFKLKPTPNKDGSYDMYEESSAQTLATGKTIADLPSKSKVKLGKFSGIPLKWLVCRDSVDQSLRLILDGESVGVIGNKMADNHEPNNPDSNRRNYGNNRYIWSNIRQWLNSDKPANQWYTAQHTYDAAPDYTNVAGFLHEWTEKEISVLENASWVVTKHSVDGGGSESFQSKVALPSTTEMGLESNTGGARIDIFNNNEDRVVSGVPYWCRTPYSSNAYDACTIHTGGTLHHYRTDNTGYGVRPLCKPVASTLVSNEPDSDGCYTLVFTPPLERTVVWDKKKEFYARQFTYNSKKQYQTMLEGATAYLPIMPDGQELSKLPSKSKVKLGRYGDADLQWLVSRNAENKLILVMSTESMTALGSKILDAAEPSNGDSDRQKYGNNRCIYTNLHQWLNAEKGANQWFVKAHNADTPPDYQNQAGFLNGWKKEELDLLELAEWTVTKSGTDGSGKETFRSRVVLPSTTEMGFSSEGGGSKLDIFNSDSDRQTGSTYWTRTPFPTSPCINYQVKSDGTQYSGGYNSYDGAIRPICSIPETTLVSIETDSEGCFTLV